MVTVARATGKAVSSVALATVAVWLLHEVNSHSHKDMCSKQSDWDWSLDSDCFRVGFLWPLLLLLAMVILSAALAVYCLLPRSQNSTGFCGVGNREKPVRRLLGLAIMRDNRLSIGCSVVALSSAQAALLWYAWNSLADPTSLMRSYIALSFQLAMFVALANALFLALYIYSDRMLYAGLFPWPLPALVLLNQLISSCEVYFSFFTPATGDVPIFGRSASLYSNTLVVSTLISSVLVLGYSRAQLRPVFARPLTAVSDSGHLEHYMPAHDVEANAYGDSDATPLARSADIKPMPLVESPEFNVSWYSALTFSWCNNALRLGAARRFEAADLYSMEESDRPIPSWLRYVRYRKPGRSLLASMLMVFAPELFLQAGLALATSLLHFSGPFFLQRILRSIEVLGGGGGNESGHSRPAEKSIRGAYLDAFGLLLFSLAAIVLTHQTQWVGRRIGFRLKGLLVAELSSKTLRRRGKGSWEDAKSAEKDDDGVAPVAQAAADGKIMNLLTADFAHVCEVFIYLDKSYSLPFILVLGIWYMYLLLGVSALVGLSMILLFIPLSKVLFKYLAKVEEKLTSLSDERVTVITELLQGIKAVKLFGWESRFLAMVDERHKRQLECTWEFFLAWVRINVVSSLTPTLVLVAIFAIFVVGFGNKLSAEIAFTSILVFQYIRMVFQRLPGFLNWVIGGYVALGRIDSYLGQPQVQDLEKRVDFAASDRDELGFESADLEWEGSSSSAKSGNEN
ncbi:hypothetical protein GGI10_004627, partial [Coemansia sp. RSA 2530]